MLTIATEVVGAIDALKPMAMPRPRRIVPLPRSKGSRQSMRCGEPVEHRLDRGVAHDRAGRLRPAVAQDVLAAKLERIEAERAGDQIGVALIGPNELRNAEAAQRAGRRAVGIDGVGIDVRRSRCRRVRRR